jgi:hypothetical protein
MKKFLSLLMLVCVLGDASICYASYSDVRDMRRALKAFHCMDGR